ncbi:transposase for ISMyma06 [Mycobacteroides abscessus subsp. massiliense]|nr:transposase for ISMyma06 [Mycobacteroides abscessus subsp. massiliense]
MVHANACLTPKGRLRLARCVVDDGWTYARAADRFQCSPATAKKWADRYRAGGPEAMNDKSSRPHTLAIAAPWWCLRQCLRLHVGGLVQRRNAGVSEQRHR